MGLTHLLQCRPSKAGRPKGSRNKYLKSTQPEALESITRGSIDASTCALQGGQSVNFNHDRENVKQEAPFEPDHNDVHCPLDSAMLDAAKALQGFSDPFHSDWPHW
jgi:hypothetical protein